MAWVESVVLFYLLSDMQKWPKSITAIRHVRSAYNGVDKEAILGYQEFATLFDEEYEALNLARVLSSQFPSQELKRRATELAAKLESKASDYDTDIAEGAEAQAVITGSRLQEYIEVPHAIYVSPYKRTRKTLEGLIKGWPKLGHVRTFEEDRIREQEYGKQAAYTDWRLYFVFHPDQALLSKKSTQYEYKHDQGESLLNVRDRMRAFTSTLIREHGGRERRPENIMLVTHHLLIMAMRANFERWSREVFLEKNENDRPPNCSVTTYEGVPTSPNRSPQGQEGRLVLKHKNLVLY